MEKDKKVDRTGTNKQMYRHIRVVRKEDLNDVPWREYRDHEDSCGRETATAWGQEEKCSGVKSRDPLLEKSQVEGRHKPMSYASMLSRPVDRTQVDSQRKLPRQNRQHSVRRLKDPLSVNIASGRCAQRRMQSAMKREDEFDGIYGLHLPIVKF